MRKNTNSEISYLCYIIAEVGPGAISIRLVLPNLVMAAQ